MTTTTNIDDKAILSDITVHMKYARYLNERNRRETWNELIERNKQMHLKKYGKIEGYTELIETAYKMVKEKKILPSMRSCNLVESPSKLHLIEFTIVHICP